MEMEPALLGANGAAALGGEASDEELVRRIRAGEAAWFEVFVRRFNARLFRVARAIVKDEAAAEDVMQETYLRAFTHLEQFEGRSSLATWLTRIAVNEAIARRRKMASRVESEALLDDDVMVCATDPEASAHRAELVGILSGLVDALPETLRVVFVLRMVENMSVAETAAALDISEENVKVRLFRARAALRERLSVAFDEATAQLFDFHLDRCDRVVREVLTRLAALGADVAPSPWADA
jgi:RNA polymerase sigma-70 factor (ECF subfamily)